jgi:hypothetical protein
LKERKKFALIRNNNRCIIRDFVFGEIIQNNRISYLF